MPEWRIREARPEDCHQILHLIKVGVITLMNLPVPVDRSSRRFFKGWVGGGG